MSRIAIIDLVFHWPPTGGSMVELKELAKHHEVTLFVAEYHRYFPRGLVKEKLPFNVVKIPFNIFTLNSIQARHRFRKAVKKYNPDIVFFADGWTLKPHLVNAFPDYKTILRFFAYEALCPRNNEKMKVDVPCDNDMLKSSGECLRCMFTKNHLGLGMHEYFTSFAFMPGYRKKLERAVTNVDKIVVYNQILKKRLSEFNNNIFAMPSGIDTSRFKPGAGTRDEEIVNVFCPGRLSDPAKGLNYLINAGKQLWEKRQDFRFLVTSEIQEDLPFVSHLGWVPYDRIQENYRQADLCVVPSVWAEAFGRTAAEAMACGLPVIASRTGGLQEIVEDGRTGFLVEPGSVPELVRRIDTLIEDKNLRLNMGGAGTRRVQDKFSWDAIMNIYLNEIFI
jgi:glycosyltransferase involved in cell wall biosynthesis